MLLPSIFGESLLDDWMDFPRMKDFDDIDRKLYGKHATHVMKTDVQEHEDGYELDIDLPGFKKDEIRLTLENGYLSVSAEKGMKQEEKTKKGKVIRKERYVGSMQRTFYVGEVLTQEDVKAKFEDGVLKISLPKKEAETIPKNNTIAIEG